MFLSVHHHFILRSVMFPPAHKTQNGQVQYALLSAARLSVHLNAHQLLSYHGPRHCAIFHTMMAPKTELLYPCQHYAGKPPLVSHLQMTIKYIHSYILLENHPVSHLTIKYIHSYIMVENDPLLTVFK
jgi:hypothetical protein